MTILTVPTASESVNRNSIFWSVSFVCNPCASLKPIVLLSSVKQWDWLLLLGTSFKAARTPDCQSKKSSEAAAPNYEEKCLTLYIVRTEWTTLKKEFHVPFLPSPLISRMIGNILVILYTVRSIFACPHRSLRS